MRVLVLGGYGNFGGIISRALCAIEGVEVVVAGRDGTAAARFAAPLGAEPAQVDARDARLAERLARLRSDWVVHTAGPFQGAGHHVARAALEAAASYVDIADARGFVCGIGALDAEARERGVRLLSGASSVPALSSAVVDRYAPELATLRAIDIGIASSARLPGRATVEGVLSYCGRPFEAWHGGGWKRVHGWQGLRRHVFRVPRFGRWLADCDVPDLDLLTARYPGIERVSFGASAGSTLAQAALFAAAIPGRLGWPVGRVLTGPLWRLGRMMEPLGPRRSAMFVRLSGADARGSPREILWELVAENHEGRRIPCLGAVAVIRKALAGRPAEAGARPCVGVIDLDEYLAELRGLPLSIHVHRDVLAPEIPFHL